MASPWPHLAAMISIWVVNVFLPSSYEKKTILILAIHFDRARFGKPPNFSNVFLFTNKPTQEILPGNPIGVDVYEISPGYPARQVHPPGKKWQSTWGPFGFPSVGRRWRTSCWICTASSNTSCLDPGTGEASEAWSAIEKLHGTSRYDIPLL
jgi:hypothetical protein